MPDSSVGPSGDPGVEQARATEAGGGSHGVSKADLPAPAEHLSQSAMSPDDPRYSLATAKWGLDGVREHWTPGNRKTGKPATQKRAFASEVEAQTFIDERPHLQKPSYRGTMSAYRCGVCDGFHIGRSER